MVNVANRKIKGRAAKKGGSFKYVKHDPSEIKKRADRKGGRFDSPFKSNVDVFRPKEGDNAVRILPPTWDKHKHFGYTVYAHRYIGPDESTYMCPRKMLNKPCPICEAANDAKSGGEEDEAKRLSPTELTLYWIIDRADDSKEPMPIVYMVHWMADRDITGLTTASRSGAVLYVDQPDEGFDLIIRRTGSGLRTRYTYSFDREPTPIDDDPDHQEKILDYIQENPLSDVLRFFPNDYLEKLVTLTSESEDEDLDGDDDEEEEGRDREAESEQEEREAKAHKKKAKKPRDEDDDDDDGESDDDDRGSSKRKRRPARDTEDDEDDDAGEDDEEDQDEDEEEERPKSKKKKPWRDDDDDEADAEGDAEEEDEDDAEVEEDSEDEDEDEEPRRPVRRIKREARRPTKPVKRKSRR